MTPWEITGIIAAVAVPLDVMLYARHYLLKRRARQQFVLEVEHIKLNAELTHPPYSAVPVTIPMTPGQMKLVGRKYVERVVARIGGTGLTFKDDTRHAQ